ncbi:stage II sporulation protein M [Heliorestis convoluta]|uniref:Stage II sporulation protein M n=1 Tax=Heliorestis convoluta TaxID=356322 RepID=A0A5Q2MW56_9FIRM|nr:stage II sporulation protein M [Heliorestis convoluta]QGG46528.1 Stage II sporulation protein M [Heliorestis convoluta]
MLRTIKVLMYHFNLHWSFYLAIVVVISAGIAIGAIGARALPPEQLEILSTRISDAFYIVQSGLDYHSLAYVAITRNLTVIGLILFLGLTVLGLPFIVALLFFRGFVLGFTASFLMLTREDGIFIVLLSLVPSSLLFIPALAITGAIALAFSLWLIKGRQDSSISLGKALMLYMTVGGATLLIAIIAALLDAYVSPLFLRWFVL